MPPLWGGEGKCPRIPHADLPSPGTLIQQKPQPSRMDAEEGKGGLGAIARAVLFLSMAVPSFLQINGGSSFRGRTQSPSPSPNTLHPTVLCVPPPSRALEGPLPLLWCFLLDDTENVRVWALKEGILPLCIRSL